MRASEAIAALQEEIRAAGRAIERRWRTFVWLYLLAGLVVAGFALVGVIADSWRNPLALAGGVLAAMLMGSTATVFYGVAGAVLFAPYAAVRQRMQRRRLRRDLAGLPRDERARVLLPLRSEEREYTRELAEMLIHEFRAGRNVEVAPAAACDGRGDEAAPE